MDDRVSEILKSHIENAEKQLRYTRNGVSFDGITDPIPSKEADLLDLIAKWQDELARHEARKTNY